MDSVISSVSHDDEVDSAAKQHVEPTFAEKPDMLAVISSTLKSVIYLSQSNEIEG